MTYAEKEISNLSIEREKWKHDLIRFNTVMSNISNMSGAVNVVGPKHQTIYRDRYMDRSQESKATEWQHNSLWQVRTDPKSGSKGFPVNSPVREPSEMTYN